MRTERASTPVAKLTFRLGVLGAMQEARYTEALMPLGLKPKHVALISALRLGSAQSQQELAQVLRIAPSLVVLLADQLEQRGLVARVRDTRDRRRQHLVLTPAGETALAQCVDLVTALDEELVAELSTTDRAALSRILGRLAIARGLPGDS
jgi:DNA-binding MarR family transcriptional regulator